MPSFDAGYYQFTALIPVLPAGTDAKLWCWNNWSKTPLASLRELLASFRSVDVPTLAEEENQSAGAARAVPFSMNNRTHFARMVVVEDVAYNGLQRGDTLLDLLSALFPGLLPPINRESADHLPVAYLLIAIDFDSPDGLRSSVEAYLNELWLHMEQEWTLLLRHCHEFQSNQDYGRQSFVRLLMRYEIETTFSFTNYNWMARKVKRCKRESRDHAPLRSLDQSRLLILGILSPFLACVIPIIIVIIIGLFAFRAPAVLGLVALIVPLMLCWHFFLKSANRPWPREPRTDLKSILKSLYLQRMFPDFLLNLQSSKGECNASLRRRFRSFLADVNHHDSDSPSFMPCCIQIVQHKSKL